MNPARLMELLQAATTHHRAGRLAEAESFYRQARVLAPKHFDVLHLSGLVAYQQNRIADALTYLGRAHELDRKAHACEMHLALALMAAGRMADAETHLRRVVVQQPKANEAWDNLAYCLKAQDRLSEAVACHEKAVTLKPDHAVAWYNYGLTLSLLGRYADALRCHERALAADPSYALARFGRAQALHQSDRMVEAVADYRAFLALQPGHHEARSYLLYALHSLDGVSREEVFAEHQAYGRAIGPAPALRFANAPDPERRLRVAVLSPDLRVHSCAYFLEPLLRQLDREKFELYLYHDHFREDALSAKFKGLAAVWRNFVGQSGPIVERTIRADAPDILIDLAGHTGMTNRLPLFARRLAPVQITYLGYPDTTGVPAMDYRFTDEWADPAGEAERFATEQLVRFSSCAWSYQPPDDAPAPQERAAEASGITFGCFNTPAKIGDSVLAVWARLLAAVPESRLVLKGAGLGEPARREAYVARLARLGIAAERVELLERTPDTASHLALYHRVDVALDTFPYGGTTTTCEALWMGVPVVTRAGDRHMSRVGVSLLHAAGHPEWIARDADDYVRLAAELGRAAAAGKPARAALHADVRRGALLDHAGQAARFGAALRACWRTWCAREVAAA